MKERIQKILSARGIASRRKAEEYIRAGLVKVNGTVAKIGDSADPAKDRIEVDGKVLEERREMLYFLMHKPVGVVTSNVDRDKRRAGDRAGTRGRSASAPKSGNMRLSPEKSQEKTVRDILPPSLQGRVFPVGRLDKDSSGLLLFTNDGVLAYRLTHPKFDHEKEYEVTVDRAIPGMVLKWLAQGITLGGKRTKPAQTRKIDARTFRITLTEGRNRQIRRMCQQEGFTVKKLERVRIMNIEDGKLKPGEIRPLTAKEREGLLRAISDKRLAIGG